MTLRKPFMTLFLSLLFMSIPFVSIAEKSTEIEESLKVCNECKQLKNIKKITYVRDYGINDFGKWQIYDKNKDRFWISEINLIFNSNKLRVISYFKANPGGDTAQYSDYYFRIDGTTAYIEEDYRILAGYDTQTVTKVYLNPKGEIIGRNITVYDLHTKKEKKDEENPEYEFSKIFKTSKELLKKVTVKPPLTL
jgi:hypothetical protein